MEESFNKERILARVKKMMMLANDAAATEGERDNALRMAHATLAKYNLNMAQAEATGLTPEEQRTDSSIRLREYAWMRGVAGMVGRLFFCDYFIVPQPAKHAYYVFVGKESNVYTVCQMVPYILRSINKEATAQAVACGETARGTYWRSFCKGAAQRVMERCAILIREAQQVSQQQSTGTSLVLASVYASERQANSRYMTEQMQIKNLKQRTDRQQMPQREGYMAGRTYGEKIGLNTQLANKE